MLDTAARLFYARGVHEVGMDELIREAGLGKATVYRLFPTKDLLVGAYLKRLAGEILGEIDRRAADADSPGQALQEMLAAIEADLRRSGFRGCAFNNASIEFDDPAHPARVAARRTAAISMGGCSPLLGVCCRGRKARPWRSRGAWPRSSTAPTPMRRTWVPTVRRPMGSPWRTSSWTRRPPRRPIP